MISEIMALATTADAALVPSLCNTREVDSNVASSEVKGPQMLAIKISSSTGAKAPIAGKSRFIGKEIYIYCPRNELR